MDNISSEFVSLKNLPEKTADGERNQEAVRGDAKPMNLTEKTVCLMQKISEYSYLTLEEIGLIYTNQTYAYRVINDLKRRDVLDEFKTTLQPRKALYLKAAGYRLLDKHGKLRVSRRFHPEDYKPFIFKHRMACAKAGLILETHPLILNFQPESVLWERRENSKRKLCDAEFMFQAPGWDKALRVGLEVELTLKNRDKLHDSLRDLHARDDLDQVWWICADSGLLGSISRMIGKLTWLTSPQHFLCTMDELLADRHKVSLLDSAGVVYAIDPAGATLPLPPEPEPPPVKTGATSFGSGAQPEDSANTRESAPRAEATTYSNFRREQTGSETVNVRRHFLNGVGRAWEFLCDAVAWLFDWLASLLPEAEYTRGHYSGLNWHREDWFNIICLIVFAYCLYYSWHEKKYPGHHSRHSASDDLMQAYRNVDRLTQKQMRELDDTLSQMQGR